MNDEEAFEFYDNPENLVPAEGDPVRRKQSVARDIPRSKYPVTLIAFGPKHEIQFVRCLKDAGVMEIPGLGPGSVVRLVTVFGDGTYEDHWEGT